MSESIYSKPILLIRLPFKCDERMEKWGLHAYKNEECYEQFEVDQQYFIVVLFVIARKQRRKVEGSFKIVDDDDDDDGRGGDDLGGGDA